MRELGVMVQGLISRCLCRSRGKCLFCVRRIRTSLPVSDTTASAAAAEQRLRDCDPFRSVLMPARALHSMLLFLLKFQFNLAADEGRTGSAVHDAMLPRISSKLQHDPSSWATRCVSESIIAVSDRPTSSPRHPSPFTKTSGTRR